MRWRVGEFEVDEARFELTRASVPVAVQPNPLQLLLCLLRRHPAAVSKRELFRALWLGVHGSEASLARAAAALRRALGEAAHGEGRLRTVPRRGYRIGGPVERWSASRTRTRWSVGPGPGGRWTRSSAGRMS